MWICEKCYASSYTGEIRHRPGCPNDPDVKAREREDRLYATLDKLADSLDALAAALVERSAA